jgi:hypothetical protein
VAHSKLRELKKIAGYGRTTPMVATGVYIAPPATANKQRFRTHEAIVINPEAVHVFGARTVRERVEEGVTWP